MHEEEKQSPLDIRAFLRDLDSGDTDSLKERLVTIFSRLPYSNEEKWVERDFQNVIYIVFMLLGQYTICEMHTSKGRADCIVETDDFIYIFEFKRDKSARGVY